MSAHRDPDMVADYARNAQMRGLRVIIAGAGLSAALPGVVAAHTAPAGDRRAPHLVEVRRRRARRAPLDRADAARGAGRLRGRRHSAQRRRARRAHPRRLSDTRCGERRGDTRMGMRERRSAPRAGRSVRFGGSCGRRPRASTPRSRAPCGSRPGATTETSRRSRRNRCDGPPAARLAVDLLHRARVGDLLDHARDLGVALPVRPARPSRCAARSAGRAAGRAPCARCHIEPIHSSPSRNAVSVPEMRGEPSRAHGGEGLVGVGVEALAHLLRRARGRRLRIRTRWACAEPCPESRSAVQRARRTRSSDPR